MTVGRIDAVLVMLRYRITKTTMRKGAPQGYRASDLRPYPGRKKSDWSFRYDLTSRATRLSKTDHGREKFAALHRRCSSAEFLERRWTVDHSFAREFNSLAMPASTVASGAG
jgi:hypothetical protein